MKLATFVYAALGSLLLSSAALADIEAPAIDAGAAPAGDSISMPADPAAVPGNAAGSSAGVPAEDADKAKDAEKEGEKPGADKEGEARG